MHVLVATDGSRRSEVAVELVAGLRLPVDAIIDVVTVLDPKPMLDPFGTVAAASLAALDERVAESARHDRDAVVARLSRAGLTVEARVLTGPAARVLADRARSWPADILVLGSRGRGQIRTMLLGSVSAELAHDSPCPVLVARRTRAERILLGADGSAAARAAETSLTMPIFAGCDIEVMTVGEPAYQPSDVARTDRDAEHAEALLDAAARACRTASAVATRLLALGLKASTWSATGDPAGSIIDRVAVTGADLVVLGTRGLTGIDGLLLGSVARNVLTHARCSVMVVPATDR